MAGFFVERSKAAAPAVLVGFNLFLFGTFFAFLGNEREFDLGYLDLALTFLALAIAAAAVLTLFGLTLPGRAFSGYVGFLFALGVLLWLQRSFLSGGYGVFDGRGIDWAGFSAIAHLDVAIWLAALAAGVVLSRHLMAIAPFTSWLLLALQAVLMIFLGVSAAGPLLKRAAPPVQIPSELLEYSSRRNVVHILLDSFQTDVFQELVEEQQLADELEGFVLFQENVAVAPYTSFSIPAIFSGRPFQGNQLPGDYYKEAIEKGFQSRLHEAGYTVNLVPTESMEAGKYSHYYEVPTVYAAGAADLRIANAARLFDVALFRQSPHFLRRIIYNENRWLIAPAFSGPENVATYQEKLFFRDYVENIRLTNSKPAYHFLHLLPPHPPYVTRADGSHAGEVLASTRENYKNEARAILKIFLDLLSRLKQLGVYDSSLILLQGDHGSQVGLFFNGERIETCLPRMAALLTVKLPSSSGPLRVSRAPTSLLDVAPTVLKAAGLDGEATGSSVFEIDPATPRSRPFFIFENRPEGPEITRYSINGFVSEGVECLEEDRVQRTEERYLYRYGTTIECGLMGNADPYLGSGWSAPMSKGCWNSGPQAELIFHLEPVQSELLLKARLFPHIRPGAVPQQRVLVSANGTRLDEWIATRARTSTLATPIPKEISSSPQLTVKFDFPDATAPTAVEGGGDRRALAVMMSSFRLDTLPLYDYGTVLELGAEGNAEPFLGMGWTAASEAKIRWSDGSRANLYLRLPEVSGDLLLETEFIPYVKPEAPRQRIRLLANGSQVALWETSEQKLHVFRTKIPRRLLRSAVLTLGFELPDAVSPSEIGRGTDSRTLAIAVRKLHVSPAEEQ